MCDGKCALHVVLSVSHVRRHGRGAAGTHELGTLNVTLSSAGPTDVLIPLSTIGQQLLRGARTAQATATLSAPGVPTTNRLVAPSVTLGL